MTAATTERAADAGALSDVRVLELGSMLAGPFTGALLGDFGAEVIKVEKPGKPDALRDWPPFKDGVALWWKTLARNKRLVTLDISKAEARPLAERLIARSDIVIENFRPGTLERWGLDPQIVLDRYPQTVWVRTSGYGQTGPYRDQGGYATIAEAYCGLASFTGYPDRGPMVSAFPMADYLAGLFGALGAMVALHARTRRGGGQVVDVSLFEPLFRIIESAVVRYDQLGERKPRLGNQMEEDVPRNIYATADGGFIAISCGSQRIFENLAEAIGRPELKGDPRFASMAKRVENRSSIDRVIAEWMAEHETDEALERLHRQGVVAGKVYDMADVFADPQFAARNAIVQLMDPELGSVRMPAPAPRLSATPGQVRWGGRPPAADNAYVYEELLEVPAAELSALAERSLI